MSKKIYLQLSMLAVILCLFAVVLAISAGEIAQANAVAVSSISSDEHLSDENSDWHGGTPLDESIESLSNSSEPEDSSSQESDSQTPSSSEHASQSESSSSSSSSASSSSSSTQSSHSSSAASESSSSHSPASSESSSSASSSSSPSSSSPSSIPSSEPSNTPSSSESNSSGNAGTLSVTIGGKVTEMDAYDIICQVVEAEMGGSFQTEALKAQAVAAYTYLRYENNAGRSPSVSTRAPTEKTKSAVAAVIGETVSYGGKLAFTPYHACSAGYTNSSAEIWGGSYAYLVSVSSAYDPPSNYLNRTTVISVSTVRGALEEALSITLGDDPASWMTITQTNQGGYVNELTIIDAEGNAHFITGRKLRENILNYMLKSHAFTFTIDGSDFTFVTNGYGHGVGMSQSGANGYAANEGWSYRDILSHYYPGTVIS